MTEVDDQNLVIPSVRLVQILRVYCGNLDRQGIEDLRDSLRADHYPWLESDLAAALTSRDLDPSWWIDAIGDAALDPGTHGDDRVRQQRLLWRTLFPGRPMPAPSRVDRPSVPSRP